MTFNSGEAFGEKALQSGEPRAGTCKANSETYCAVVEKELYLKVLNKLNMDKAQRMNRFLRQIKFVHAWTSKEVTTFKYLLKVKEIKRCGTKIIMEGLMSNEVIIVKDGAVEVTKCNFSKVFMNNISGIIQNKLGDN